MKKLSKILTLLIILALNIVVVEAYKIEDTQVVHQHITNESQETWKDMPDEMKAHLTNSRYVYLDNNGYDLGDDIISGSGEEDTDVVSGPSPYDLPFLGHFWEPDNPRSGRYDDGLNLRLLGEQIASYRRARSYWLKYVIPLYLSGDIDQSYYWLGRVAHFLQDASQPSHVLMDCHPHRLVLAQSRLCNADNGGNIEDDDGFDDSVLEEYTGGNFLNYDGNKAGQAYNYQTLIQGFTESDWQNIDARFKDSKYLFRLMWYTAQKPQPL